jgi:hypothetical protein
MAKKTPRGSAKSTKEDGKASPKPKKREHPERSGWKDAPGGPKERAPDKHGGSGAGRQEGGSGAGRER